MTRLPCGESCGGEPEPNPLGFRFAESGANAGKSPSAFKFWLGLPNEYYSTTTSDWREDPRVDKKKGAANSKHYMIQSV
jgi:hypothetical protein